MRRNLCRVAPPCAARSLDRADGHRSAHGGPGHSSAALAATPPVGRTDAVHAHTAKTIIPPVFSSRRPAETEAVRGLEPRRSTRATSRSLAMPGGAAWRCESGNRRPPVPCKPCVQADRGWHCLQGAGPLEPMAEHTGRVAAPAWTAAPTGSTRQAAPARYPVPGAGTRARAGRTAAAGPRRPALLTGRAAHPQT